MKWAKAGVLIKGKSLAHSIFGAMIAPHPGPVAEHATIPTSYSMEGEPTEDGILRDLSKTGCQILSLQPPPAGSQVTVTLYLPDAQPPMCLDGTTVSWVQGQRFGGRFRPLTSSERRRLQTAVLQRATFSRSGLQRTAFRLV